MKVFLETLGCRLNEAELEIWASQFQQRGFGLAETAEAADLLILNTCSVTGEADRKSRNIIRRLHRDHPQSRLVVTGCYASLQAEQVRDRLGVDLVVPNTDKDALVDQVIDGLSLEPGAIDEPGAHALFARGRHRAFIKVQDGCRYRCTYCIVTLARGEERSRPVAEIVEEVNRHHRAGVQEVVIAGVHVGGYGSDTGNSLYGLLGELLEKTDIPRLRLASVEPWDLPEYFFDLFQDARLMPHMHLPLQSGSDSVLRRMSRRCKTAEFERLVDHARSAVPNFNVTTDLIVGFPGETDAEWQETMRFVERVGFGNMHIFPFSPREGTKAATLGGQVPAAIKKARSQEMHALARELKMNALGRQLGSECEVLWESRRETGVCSGYTPNFHRVAITSPADLTGTLARVRLTSVDSEGERLVAAQLLGGVEIGVGAGAE